MSEYLRGQIVSVTVTGAAHYGVFVTVPSGERGWIESHYLDDVRVP
jgi:predicted RNA-binding protein with RPS1 domain